MEEVAPGRVRLSVQEYRDLARQALGRIGYDAEEAAIVAEHVLDAALCGYEYSGVPKILNVSEHPQLHKPRTHMRIRHETRISAGTSMRFCSTRRVTSILGVRWLPTGLTS